MDCKYYDLNIPRGTGLPALIARLLDCDYLYIGITTSVNMDQFNFKDKKKSAKHERQAMRKSLADKMIPLSSSDLAILLQESELLRSFSSSRLPKLSPPRLFNRLSLACSNTETAGLFFKEFDSNICKFDVVAFEPNSLAALNYVIESQTSLPIDLITVNPSSFNDFRPTGKQCAQCLRRGVYFEIPLSPLLFRSGTSNSARIALSALLTHLDSVCRFQFSRLIVISSGAQTEWEVRRPQAIASVLSAICPTIARENAPLAMQQINPWQAISRGLMRRDSKVVHGAAILLRLLSDPSVVEIVKVNEAQSEQVDKAESSSSTFVHQLVNWQNTDNIEPPRKKKRCSYQNNS